MSAPWKDQQSDIMVNSQRTNHTRLIDYKLLIFIKKTEIKRFIHENVQISILQSIHSWPKKDSCMYNDNNYDSSQLQQNAQKYRFSLIFLSNILIFYFTIESMSILMKKFERGIWWPSAGINIISTMTHAPEKNVLF